MAKMGRPRKEFNQEQFEKLCAMQATEVEIAGWFDFSVDTLNYRCKEIYGETFSEAYKRLSADGKVSLRRAMFQKAMDGNVTMMIWLSKQYLGMKEKTESVVTTDPEKKLVIQFSKGGQDEKHEEKSSEKI